MPRAAIWDSCARAASGAGSRELFDAAASDPAEVSDQARRARAVVHSVRGVIWRYRPWQSEVARAEPSRPARPAFVVPRRPRRVADGWTDRPPENSRPGQQKRRHYGAGSVRRKAERGRRRRRRRRPPQRCGPRPSPQVTGGPSPSRPDPPLSSPPGGPETTKSLPSEPRLCLSPGTRGVRQSPDLTRGGGAGSRGLLSGLFGLGLALGSSLGRAMRSPGNLGEGAGQERSSTTPARNLVQQKGYLSCCRPVGMMLPIAQWQPGEEELISRINS